MTAEEEAKARQEHRWIFSDESPTPAPPADTAAATAAAAAAPAREG
jgi:hypothetical protein